VARFVLGQDYATISAFKPLRAGDLVGPVFMVLETHAGQLVTIEVNNNAAYGYDIRAELVCVGGAVAMTPVSHTRRDAGLCAATSYDPDWRSRYAEAYRRQDKAFVRFVQTGVFSPIAADAWDGYAAAVVAEAGVRALRQGGKVAVQMAERPALYSGA
jgi:myo-inositol 2-dehydrogenase/D-chiro-inositol 1-dehydrogenase